MTDPNVIEAIRKLAQAVKAATRSAPEPGSAYCDAAEVEAEMMRLLAAEKPAAPVVQPATPALPWVVRRKEDKVVVAAFQDGTSAEYYRGLMRPRSDAWEVAPAAPAIVPVGAARRGDGWEADVHDDVLSVAMVLHPGEDAGEVTARMLAAVGRGP